MGQEQHNSCRKQHGMNVAVSAQDMLAAIAGPRQWADTRERWIERAASEHNSFQRGHT